MAETNAEKTQASPAGRKKQLAAGIMVVVCLLGAAFFLWSRSAVKREPAKTAVTAVGSYGVIDIRRALQAHKQGEMLTELRHEQEGLSMRLRQARQQLLWLMAPKLGRKPFADAARQKAEQELIHTDGKFMAELDKQEKEKREALRPEYEKARDEINQLFLNEIFNIRLKLDNASSLKLSEEEVSRLQARLKELQHQRGVRQKALYDKYEGAIREWKEAVAAQHGIDMRAFLANTEQQRLAEEMKKRSEAQGRDLKALQDNMKQRVEQRRRVAELQLALKAKQREADKLEAEIMKTVAGKVAKLAMLHHLEAVFAQSPRKTAADNLSEGLAPRQIVPDGYTRLVNVRAVDLTEELLRELGAS